MSPCWCLQVLLQAPLLSWLEGQLLVVASPGILVRYWPQLPVTDFPK